MGGGRSARRPKRLRGESEAVVIGVKEHHVSDRDRAALEQMIEKLRRLPAAYRPHVGPLATKLRRASSAGTNPTDADVVTMNSRVRLRDLDDGRTETFTLVYHGEAEDLCGRISVASDLGTALLGARVGDVVEWSWSYRGLTRRMRIERVDRQPKPAGEPTE
jgi:regulator of nucleoside diphosphate kinase